MIIPFTLTLIIINNIMDAIQYKNFELTMKELKETFICINCNEIKDCCYFHDDFCSSTCYMQWRDFPLYINNVI